MTEPTTPAGRLVAAFGNIDAMAQHYAPDIIWSLPQSAPYDGPIRGRDAVIAFNTEVWTKHYRPDCSVEILDEVGDETNSAVRFVYRAHMNAANRAYANEYTLFARADAQGIRAVFESFDTLQAGRIARGEV